MNPQKLLAQVVVGMILFTVIAVILEGNYAQDIWLEKGKMAMLFGIIYGIFLWVKERLRKKD